MWVSHVSLICNSKCEVASHTLFPLILVHIIAEFLLFTPIGILQFLPRIEPTSFSTAKGFEYCPWGFGRGPTLATCHRTVCCWEDTRAGSVPCLTKPPGLEDVCHKMQVLCHFWSSKIRNFISHWKSALRHQRVRFARGGPLPGAFETSTSWWRALSLFHAPCLRGLAASHSVWRRNPTNVLDPTQKVRLHQTSDFHGQPMREVNSLESERSTFN